MIPVCADCGRKHLPNCLDQRHQKAVKSSFYYPLFSHMASNHDLILLDSEMEDIFQICKKLFWSRPVEEVEGSFPVILYFGTDADRAEFSKLMQEAKPGMRVQSL